MEVRYELVLILLVTHPVRVGKSIREGMGQATDRSSDECIETVITNALIVDWSGIYKVCYMHYILACVLIVKC